MDWIIYLAIAILIVLLLFKKKQVEKEPSQAKDLTLPYKKRDDFLSASELSFYRTLRTFIENKAVICPKVAVKEIVFIGNGVGKDYMKFFNWVAKKHVDFVLCDASTMRVVCAVELDDKSHQKESRKQRDAFVDRVFDTTKIPLFHIPAKSGYSAGEFASILNCFTEQSAPAVEMQGQVAPTMEISQSNDDTHLCPKCAIPMIKRKAKQGANAGVEFYGCSNYPKCREVKQI